MSPVQRGDSEVVPDSQSPPANPTALSRPRPSHTTLASNRYTPLAYKDLKDDDKVSVFSLDSASTASADSRGRNFVPPNPSHCKESDPYRRLVQIFKLGKIQLSSFRANQGAFPEGDWLYTMEKVLIDLNNLLGTLHEQRATQTIRFTKDVAIQVRLATTLLKQLDNALTELARLSPEVMTEAQQRIKAATFTLIDSDMDVSSDAGSEADRSEHEDNTKKEEDEDEHVVINVAHEQLGHDSKESTPKSPVKRLSRSASFSETPRSIDRSSVTPAAEPDSSFIPSFHIGQSVPQPSSRVLRSHAANMGDRSTSVEVPLPTVTPTTSISQRHKQEIDSLKSILAQQEQNKMSLELEARKLEQSRIELQTKVAKQQDHEQETARLLEEGQAINTNASLENS
ncbi:hypothetical protein JOM56_011565 [Amanita muscaria]